MPEDTTITTLEEALSALREARADAAKQRTKAKAAQESLDAMTAERDALQGKLTEAEEGADALTALLEEVQERAGLDLSGLEAAKSEKEIQAALDAAFEPLTALKTQAQESATLRRERDLTQAAQALGKPADALAEILEGKALEKRTVKAQDGSESEQWGIPQGDTFKPLSELRSIQLLGTAAQPDKPAPAPLPTGQRGGNAKPTDPVQALNAALFGGPKEN